MLKINLKNSIKELNKKKAKKILLQIPEGLKLSTTKIITELEKNKFEVITSMDPCYGACDIKINEAKDFSCDAILHVGHNEFKKTSFFVTYSPLNYELKNFNNFLKKIIVFLKKKEIKQIGFVTTIQYQHYLPTIKKVFSENKIKIITKKGNKTIEAQVLGCNYTSVPETKNVLYFGDGLFHPLGIHFSTQNEVIIANPLANKISSLEKEKNDFLKQRIFLIERAKEGKRFGILVTTKHGQQNLILAKKIKKMLEEKEKTASIFIMDYFDETKLLGTSIDAYINTACPRISIDDYHNYKKPIINAYEIKYLLGKNYDDYKISKTF